MPCNLTTGFTLDCREAIGGVKSVYIGVATGLNISATTTNGLASQVRVTNASGVVQFTLSAATNLTTAPMYEFQQPRQSAVITETGNFSEENGTVFYSQVLTFFINRLQAQDLNNLKLLGQNQKLVVIVKDNNDNYFLLGNEGGAIVTNSTSSTGTAFGDRSGVQIEVTGFSTAPMFECNF